MHSIMTCFTMSLSLESAHLPEHAGAFHIPQSSRTTKREQVGFSILLVLVRAKAAFLLSLDTPHI